MEEFRSATHEDHDMARDRVSDQIARLLGEMNGLLETIAEQAREVVAEQTKPKEGR
jgi:hypothetical protein